MGVLGIDFLILGSHINFEVPHRFPFVLLHFDFQNFLLKDGIAQDIPEESVASVLIFLVVIHKISEEEREIPHKQEQGPQGQSVHFVRDVQLIFAHDHSVSRH